MLENVQIHPAGLDDLLGVYNDVVARQLRADASSMPTRGGASGDVCSGPRAQGQVDCID